MKEDMGGETVASGVRLGDAVPPAMLYCDPCLIVHRLKPHFDLSILVGSEGGLAPTEHKAMRRLPYLYLADLEDLPHRQRLDEATALP